MTGPVSRSALFVVLGLLAIATLVLLIRPTARETPPPAARPSLPASEPAAVPPPAESPTKAAELPRAPLDTRSDLATALRAQGIEPATAIGAFRAWRRRHGFFEPDARLGVTAETAEANAYAALDDGQLQILARSDDVGALQALGDRVAATDPATAVGFYSRAAYAGSAWAMLQVSRLAQSGSASPGALAQRLRGNPNADLREDALAWTLAAARRFGPAALENADLERSRQLVADLGTEGTTRACARSLAILAELSARATGQPDFAPSMMLSPANVLESLPCRDTPAPVTVPTLYAACSARLASAGDSAVTVWTCPVQ